MVDVTIDDITVLAGAIQDGDQIEMDRPGAPNISRKVTKINFVTDIDNADIAAGAAIATSKLADSANFVLIDQANTYNNGLKQTFNPSATTPGINFGSQAGDPSTPANGDVWYNSTSNKFRARENAANVDMIAAGGAAAGYTIVPKACGDQTFTNSTYANVTGLSFPVDANSEYTFIHWTVFKGSVCSSKMQYTVPACTDVKGWSDNFDQGGLGLNNFTNTSVMGTSGGRAQAMRFGAVKTGGTSGTVQVQAAKFANGCPCLTTIIRADSYIAWAKIQ